MNNFKLGWEKTNSTYSVLTVLAPNYCICPCYTHMCVSTTNPIKVKPKLHVDAQYHRVYF